MDETALKELHEKEMREHAGYEARTVATYIDGEPVTVAALRKAFEAVEDPDHWKNAILANVPEGDVALTAAAIAWFHGARPLVVGRVPHAGTVTLQSFGYAG